MKYFLKSIGVAVAIALLSSSVMAAEFTKGVVKKVNMKSHKVTIIHEELKDLGMPAMTMVFRTLDDAMLEKMEVGETIEFVADRVKGKLTVIELK
ncbi:MAG: copper-binding protein [Rhizobiaceae bacterium]|nr:copper-binding protein [Rhizobiaceae bacterium]